jgi:hypothetical protein
MHLQVPYLNVMEDLTDVVHRALDAPDLARRVRCIFLHRFGSPGLLALGSEAPSDSWDPWASWFSGPEVTSESLDLAAAWPTTPRGAPGIGT